VSSLDTEQLIFILSRNRNCSLNKDHPYLVEAVPALR